MSDSGRAGGHCQNTIPCSGAALQSLVHTLLIICIINDLQELLHSGCPFQCRSELLIHQHHGKLTQHVQMHIVLRIGCRDEEQQIRGFSVQRIKVHTIPNHHSRKARCLHRIALSVGDRDAFPDTGGALCFSLVYYLPIFLHICQLAAFTHQFDGLIQCFFLVCRFCCQGNTSLVQ